MMVLLLLAVAWKKVKSRRQRILHTLLWFFRSFKVLNEQKKNSVQPRVNVSFYTVCGFNCAHAIFIRTLVYFWYTHTYVFAGENFRVFIYLFQTIFVFANIKINFMVSIIFRQKLIRCADRWVFHFLPIFKRYCRRVLFQSTQQSANVCFHEYILIECVKHTHGWGEHGNAYETCKHTAVIKWFTC